MCQRQLSELLSMSLYLLFQSSSLRSPRSPHSPRDLCKGSRSFSSSSRSEGRGGQTSQEYNEKVLLNLEEVKVSTEKKTMAELFDNNLLVLLFV